ncbi:T9SS type B sorting domain-containing protein [Maribacter sp. Asnod1-A12]|uniref:T9SS type B sorting domain-containing protein n=1 Tax=Maribacter sp. Asnod1-A12 TaxID=3160576 RepID=UPI0038689ECE
MVTKHHLLLFCCLIFTTQVYTQLCEGSLGDPVAEINFGSGTNVGAALGSAITAFTYSSSGELDEGEYTIANSTNGLKGNAWHVTGDHTGDTNGYMMVINSAVLSEEGVFYRKSVTGLCGNTTYEFSAWLMNVMNPSVGTDEYHPDVTFRVSDTAGKILGSYNTGDIQQTSSGTWVQYGFFFTLESETEVVITILNTAPSAHPGNDIVLDDITFKPCGPTITNSIENEVSTSIIVCEDELVNYTFQTSISAGYSDPRFQWQFSDDYGNTWVDINGETNTAFQFTDTDVAGDYVYRVSVANGDNINTVTCRIASDEFYVEVLEKPTVLVGDSEQSFCTTQTPTLQDIEVNGTPVWYDALSNGNILSETTNLTDGRTYYGAQETVNGCESEERIAITVQIVSPTLMMNNIIIDVCDIDNDGEELVDLLVYNSELSDCTDCIYSYFKTRLGAENATVEDEIVQVGFYVWNVELPIVYVRIVSDDKCSQVAEITLSLIETPNIAIDDFVGLCEADENVIVDAGLGFDSYLWSTGETTQTISVSYSNIGSYWVSVSENHTTYSCTTTKNFEVVLSNIATISGFDIKDWTDNDNSIEVFVTDTSLGDYEYSLDNNNYQNSTIFTGLLPGKYTVYVRDKNGCGTTQDIVYILYFPKFFTPNNDGVNDEWVIDYADTEPDFSVKIFDRYGKFLKQLNATSAWDGTYNGQTMPSSDYWFVVTRNDGRNYSGHFTLKR